jgi:deoxycytidylate deaminase
MSIQYSRPTWDVTRIEQAKILAKRSRCSRDQVGAIIVDAGNKVIGEGYNGPPSGFHDGLIRTGDLSAWIANWKPAPDSDFQCTNWCPRAQQKDEEEWVWSANFTDPAHTRGSLIYENGQHWWMHKNDDANRTLLDTDEKMERYGFVKTRKPGISLSATYDDCPSLHAEANALITSDRSLRVGGTIYITSDVCMGCAKLIANSGLTRVYVKTGRYDKHRSPEKSYDFLRQCGLTVEVHRPTTRGTSD